VHFAQSACSHDEDGIRARGDASPTPGYREEFK
jgi:hypothetical protein